jgi:hypothetical protein
MVQLDAKWTDPESPSLKRKRATHSSRWIFPQEVDFNDELDPADFPAWGFNPNVTITFASSSHHGRAPGSTTASRSSPSIDQQ